MSVSYFLSADDAKRVVDNVEKSLGAKISPTYASWKRVNLVENNSTFSTSAALPPNLTVNIGDLVEASSRYRDPNLPCNFIPWIVVAVVTPALAKTP